MSVLASSFDRLRGDIELAAQAGVDAEAQLDQARAELAALRAKYNALVDTVHVGFQTLPARTLLGMTSVHGQTRNAQTKAILARCSAVNNQHLLGFGSTVNPQPGPGAAFDWSFIDATFGPGGYFPEGPQCLTLCGCPPHMRFPKPNMPPDPMGPRAGAQLTSLSDYSPPHSSWFEEATDLWAGAVARSPRITHVQLWNEGKGFYITTVFPGSRVVQPEWNLPVLAGGNRWWPEGMAALTNLACAKIRRVRPDVKIISPYMVLNTYTSQYPHDWAPDLQGPWGHADQKVLDVYRYFLTHCPDIDMLGIDVKNGTKDGGVTVETQWSGGQKVIDFLAWLRTPTADPSSPRAATIDVWSAETYARTALPAGHAEEVATWVWQYVNYFLLPGVAGCLDWKPEGTIDAAGDPGESNPLGLWEQGTGIATEKAEPVNGLVSWFRPGTPISPITAADPRVSGVASPQVLCLVSRADVPITVTFEGAQVILDPFAVKFVPRTS